MDEYDPFLLSRRVSDAVKTDTTVDVSRSALFTHPLHGVLRPAFIAHDDTTMRISDVVALLRDKHVLAGWASLRAQGNEWFDGREPSGRLRPVPLLCAGDGQLRRRDGVEPWRGLVYPDEIIDLGAYQVTTLARSAYDEMCRARSLREAVVAADMACSTTSGVPRTTLTAIEQVIGSHHKVRGIVRARKALGLAGSRSASPEETRTRLAAEIDAGIAGLRSNVPIFSRATGGPLGIADLLDEEVGYVIESDGTGHRDEQRHALDNSREEAFEVHGLIVNRVTAIDRRDRWALAARLRAGHAHARAVRRPPTWTTDKPAWWDSWQHASRWE